MPVGKGRKPAPPGYLTATRTGELVGPSRMYKLAQAGRLHKYTPPGQTHGYYSEQEVNTILAQDASFYAEKVHRVPARFAHARTSDMQSLYNLAVRIFGSSTISAEKRAAWLEAEHRGNYVMRRDDTHEVISYLYVQSLSHERIMQYLRECKGSTVKPEEIRKIEPGSSHELIIGGIGTDRKADRQYTATILRGFAEDLASWGSQGIEITQIYAYSETVDGIYLSFSMGMELWKRPRYIRLPEDDKPYGPFFTFVLDVQKSNSALLKPYKAALAEYKRAHGLQPLYRFKVDKELAEQKHTTTTPRQPRQEITGEQLPDELVPFVDFYRLHGISESTARRGIGSLFEIAPGGPWNVGGFVIKQALDSAGQHAFYEAYHEKKSFTPCDQCPHA